jgi:glycosyltransferase involved in cell wall biosynthesis
MSREVHILGTRGVPAAHSGFEYLAEHLARYLAGNGWKVTVYCQLEGNDDVYEDDWEGIHRVNIPIENEGALGTIFFDWKATLISAKRPGTMLTLGYNTAVFGLLYRLKGIKNVINMDGIEWRRAKWGPIAKTWFYLNDWLGCFLGNHLIADHPEIEKHLKSRVSSKKISMIPYGAHEVEDPVVSPLDEFGLKPKKYCIIIARPVPENSILEIVSAFSALETDHKLVVLGDYSQNVAYHRSVLAAGNANVLFPGAIFDPTRVKALRFHASLYIHGHTVGGTNPSLVEALAAKSAVLAHDNKFNRWVVADAGKYFADEQECAQQLQTLLADHNQISEMSNNSNAQFKARFQWPDILKAYENLL